MLAELASDEDAQRARAAGRWAGAALGGVAGYVFAPRRWGLVYTAGGVVAGALAGGAVAGVAAAAADPVGTAASLVLTSGGS
jgi:hypothetical protein